MLSDEQLKFYLIKENQACTYFPVTHEMLSSKTCPADRRCLDYAIWGDNCSKCSTQKSHILLDLGMLSATSAH